jgi:isoleucyl-tRNA synthetase
LAEAELEYRDKVSSAVYVKFPVDSGSHNLDLPSAGSCPLYAVVWTTTPWTLLANKAICYNLNLRYSVLRTSSGDHIIVLSTKVNEIQDIFDSSCEIVAEVDGSDLSKWKYTNPLRPEDGLLPFLPGEHVTAQSGSGLVHTAPGHGPEDYQIGLEHNLDIFCPVDEHGLYTGEVGQEFKGLDVLSSGNKAVLDALQNGGFLVHSEDYVHRYPHDWRSKQPVIIRTTKQWFAAVGGITPAEALKGVTMVPRMSYNRLAAMLEGRQDWCISRQRLWGVPIPVFYHKTSDNHIITDSTIEHIQQVFAEHGSDSWWRMPVAKLLPPSLAEQHEMYETGSDTMDVWFDSGTSWATVLKEHDGVADVYLEGSDQHRGWFQSSLITSYITQGKSPYRSVVCHGFVLDSGGTKMSKSIGNVISPDDIIGKEKFGADVMRLWVASSDFTSDVTLSEQILKQTNDNLQKIRSTCRFMIGNLSDFSLDDYLVPYKDLRVLDKYVLHLLHDFCNQVEDSYESYNFSKILHLVSAFVTSDLSAFYFDVIKDCLYCDAPDSSNRRAIQTTLHHIVNQFIMTLAPIVPHLTEEVSLHFPYPHEGAFRRGWQPCSNEWKSMQTAELLTTVREMRTVVMKALDTARSEKAIGSSLDATVTLYISDVEFVESLDALVEDSSKLFSEVLVVSGVNLLTQQFEDDRSGYNCEGMVSHRGREFQISVAVQPSTQHKCPRCWKYNSTAENKLCPRCHYVESMYT